MCHTEQIDSFNAILHFVPNIASHNWLFKIIPSNRPGVKWCTEQNKSNKK